MSAWLSPRGLTIIFAALAFIFSFGADVIQELIRAQQSEQNLPPNVMSILQEAQRQEDPDAALRAVDDVLKLPIGDIFDQQYNQNLPPGILSILEEAQEQKDPDAAQRAIDRILGAQQPKQNLTSEIAIEVLSLHWNLIVTGFGFLAGALASRPREQILAQENLKLLWPFLGGLFIAGAIIIGLLAVPMPSLPPEWEWSRWPESYIIMARVGIPDILGLIVAGWCANKAAT